MPEDDDLRMNVYYLCLSAFQKCVRRGMTEHAINLGKICHRLQPYPFFARMHTVIFEEAGRDEDMLQKLFDWRGSYKEFGDLVPLIKKAADAKHSREIIALMWMMRKEVIYTEDAK